jgi:hypothetical protein
MGAIAAKLAAKRALRSPEGEAERMYEQEQERIADEKKKQVPSCDDVGGRCVGACEMQSLCLILHSSLLSCLPC